MRISTVSSMQRHVTLIAALLITQAAAVAQNATTGNAERGETLFTTTYKCFACHGYDAQTGQRRLKPMRLSEEAFTVFVQNSPLAQMPSYPDVSVNALADIYAYILSIPVDAPAVEDVPLLRSILTEKLDALDD